MFSHPAPTRTLPPKLSLAQLRKQGKELLKSCRAGEDAASAEVTRFERNSEPAHFALADAQRLLARAYGFSSWPALKNHAEGLNLQARRCTWRPDAEPWATPLAWARKHGHPEIIELLRSAGSGA